MPEQLIENHISETLIGEAQKNALAFVAYLRANDMLFERGGGYWEDKLYWLIKHKGEYVCFVLINGSVNEKEPWIIWSDDSGSNWFEGYPLPERIKEIAWSNVDICGKCGGCSVQGTPKTIFGKDFDNVCRTTMRFINPDAETVECLKELMGIRKLDIDFAKTTACGECCFGCKKKDEGLCEGCIESDGQCKEWAQSNGCPIYICAKQHKVQFCGLCPKFPCDWLVEKVTWNPNIVEDLTELANTYSYKNSKGRD